jgi:hypothetical protein
MDFVEAEAQRVLADFSRLKLRDEPAKKTFMEITRYPHYENVCSNVLAFFLDPKEPHGLGTLVFDVFLDCSSSASYIRGGRHDAISVDTEVPTGKIEASDLGSKRIDLLIMSEEHAVLVENKIRDRRKNNPYDRYARYLDEAAGDRKKHKYVLSIDPMGAGKEWGFQNLRYGEFVERVRSMLGQYISGADTRYLTLFLDFLDTLENLRRGTRMDPKLINFLGTQYDDVGKLLSQVNGVKEEMRSKTRQVRTLVEADVDDNVKFVPAKYPLTELYEGVACLVIVPGKMQVYVEANLYPWGWEIWMSSHTGDYAGLLTLLRDLEVTFEEYEEEGVTYKGEDVHDYYVNLDEIAELLKGLIDKLLRAGTARR